MHLDATLRRTLKHFDHKKPLMVIFTIVFPSILYFYVAKSRRIAYWGIPNICKFENLITFDSTMTISQPLFTVGDIVQVDNRENAYITNIHGENGDLFFNLRFIVDKTEQKNVIQYEGKGCECNFKIALQCPCPHEFPVENFIRYQLLFIKND